MPKYRRTIRFKPDQRVAARKVIFTYVMIYVFGYARPFIEYRYNEDLIRHILEPTPRMSPVRSSPNSPIMGMSFPTNTTLAQQIMLPDEPSIPSTVVSRVEDYSNLLSNYNDIDPITMTPIAELPLDMLCIVEDAGLIHGYDITGLIQWVMTNPVHPITKRRLNREEIIRLYRKTKAWLQWNDPEWKQDILEKMHTKFIVHQIIYQVQTQSFAVDCYVNPLFEVVSLEVITDENGDHKVDYVLKPYGIGL